MGKLDRVETDWTAESFLKSDLHFSGEAWRYELVDGIVVAHAAPAPLHGVVAVNIAVALRSRMKGHPCRVEFATGAVPRDQQRPTARIPDILVRCDRLPRILFEVISPSELRDWRGRNRKRRDEQDVEGVQEIVEIYQSQPSVHLYRKGAEGEWVFEAVDEMEGVLTLRSIGIDLPLAEIYDGVDFTESE